MDPTLGKAGPPLFAPFGRCALCLMITASANSSVLSWYGDIVRLDPIAR